MIDSEILTSASDEEITVPVERKAKVTGGYYTVGITEYFIPDPLYEEVVERDENTPLSRKGDKEFAKWLEAFIANNSPPIEDRSARMGGHYGGGKGLSGYWAMPYTYHGKAGTDPSTARLATILRAMRTVLTVVDPEHRLTVKYTDEGTSYWMDNDVAVPSKPATEIKDLEEAINVMSGFAIHEAWHSQYTRPIITPTCKAWLKENPWNGALTNVIEDVREEQLGLAETPGFRTYLNYAKEYLWDDNGPTPEVWPDDANGRFKCVFMWLREPDRADETLTHESFAEKRTWVEDYIRRYTAEQPPNKPTFTILKRFVAELYEWLEIREDEAPTSGCKVLTPCGYIDAHSGLSPSSVERLEEALEAELEEVHDWSSTFGEPKKGPSLDIYRSDGMKSAIIKRPRVTDAKKFRPSRNGLIDKAKAVLSLRKTQAQADTRLMKSGILDEDELYRFFADDMRIFKDATIETLPNAAVYLLVDMSGSMGHPYNEWDSAYYAVTIAQVMIEAMSKHPNIRMKVLGHTGDNNDNPGGGSFYRIWEPGDPLNRLSLLWTLQWSENYDSWAIAWAGEMLKKEQVDQRLLIVLSDGQPAAHGYGGYPARQHVREVTDRLARQGVPTLQVAVGGGISPKTQAEMFKHYVTMEYDDEEGSALGSILRKMTKILQKIGGSQ